MLVSSAASMAVLIAKEHCYIPFRNSVSFTSAETGVFSKRCRRSLLAGQALNLCSYWIEMYCHFRGSGRAGPFKSLRLNITSTSGCSPQYSCDMNVMLEHPLWWGAQYLQRSLNSTYIRKIISYQADLTALSCGSEPASQCSWDSYNSSLELKMLFEN